MSQESLTKLSQKLKIRNTGVRSQQQQLSEHEKMKSAGGGNGSVEEVHGEKHKAVRVQQ